MTQPAGPVPLWPHLLAMGDDMVQPRRWKALPVGLVSAILLYAVPSHAQQVAGSVETGLQALAQSLLASAPADRRPAISVLPFPGADQSCPVLSVFIVDELTTTFITSVQPRPRVVERQQLEAIIAQNRLDEFLTDPEQRRRMGGLSGIGAVVLGTFTGIGDRLRINARMVAIDTGEAIGAASVSVPRTREMEDLLRQGSGRGINCLPDIRQTGAGQGQASTGRTPVPQPSRTGDQACVQNGPLQACPVTLAVSGAVSPNASTQRDGTVSVVVRITNTGQEPVSLILVEPNPIVVGSDGSTPEFIVERFAGTGLCLFNGRLTTGGGCFDNNVRPRFTRITAGGSTNAVFLFRGSMSQDASASFAATFAGLRGGVLAAQDGSREPNPEERFTYSIGLSDLRVAHQAAQQRR